MDRFDEAHDLYLDLMKRCLINWIYGSKELTSIARIGRLRIMREAPMNPDMRARGKDVRRSSIAHTLIGLKRLDNIKSCVKDIIVNKVPGDLIETGVWRGGAAIFMRAALKAYGAKDRIVWLADSFEGFPEPEARQYPQDKKITFPCADELAVSLEEVKNNIAAYGLLDDQVRFLKGFFKDTLPQAPIEKLALIRLDGDLYESTIQALESLYPKLSAGGYVIIDDFNTYTVCRQAVFDYRSAHAIEDPIIEIDEDAVYWKRSK